MLEELLRIKRLDQIIICPTLERSKLVLRVPTTTDEEDRSTELSLPQRPTQLAAVRVRQVDIEQDGVGGVIEIS